MTPKMLSRRAHAEYVFRTNEYGEYVSVLPSPRIQLRDGHSISVQANKFAYCAPRCDGQPDYYSFEVGFPSFCPSFLYLAEDEDSPNTTIYPYIPEKLILSDIAVHGGLTFSERIATFCRIYTNQYFTGECFNS